MLQVFLVCLGGALALACFWGVFVWLVRRSFSTLWDDWCPDESPWFVPVTEGEDGE